VIPTTLNNATQVELQRYKNNYKAINLITKVGMCIIELLTKKLLIMFTLNCAILMRTLVKLNLLIRTLTIDSIKHFLRNLESLLMIDLLGLSRL
jgi:hypothetical protein